MLIPAIGEVLPWHWKQYCLNIGEGLGAASSAPRIVCPSVRARNAHEQSASATFRRRALTASPRSRGIFIVLSYSTSRRGFPAGDLNAEKPIKVPPGLLADVVQGLFERPLMQLGGSPSLHEPGKHVDLRLCRREAALGVPGRNTLAVVDARGRRWRPAAGSRRPCAAGVRWPRSPRCAPACSAPCRRYPRRAAAGTSGRNRYRNTRRARPSADCAAPCSFSSRARICARSWRDRMLWP